MPYLFSLLLLATLSSVCELISMAFSPAISLIDFLSDFCSFVSIRVHCSLLSFSHFLPVLDVSLGLDGGGTWASTRER